MAIAVAGNGALKFSEEAGRMSTSGSGILMSSFDRNLFLLNAANVQYAAEIFRIRGPRKQ